MKRVFRVRGVALHFFEFTVYEFWGVVNEFPMNVCVSASDAA